MPHPISSVFGYRPCASSHRAAFTLVELLVVISVIAILSLLVGTQLSKVRGNVQMAECIARLRSAGGAVQLAMNENDNRFPAVENTWDKRYHLILIPYLNDSYDPVGANTNTIINSGYFKCPTMDDLENGHDDCPGNCNHGAFAYNRELEADSASGRLAPVAAELVNPSRLPVLVTSGTAGGPRLFAANYGSIGPTAQARKFGYTGTVNTYGPNPNFNGNAVFLFADWHVEAVDVSARERWPWNDTSTFFVH